MGPTTVPVFCLQFQAAGQRRNPSRALFMEETEYWGEVKMAGIERAMHLRGQNYRAEVRGQQKVPRRLQLSNDQSIAVRKLLKAKEPLDRNKWNNSQDSYWSWNNSSF